jgi:hypothetical protein
MKQFRGIAMRYGKTSVVFSGFIQLAPFYCDSSECRQDLTHRREQRYCA